MEFELELLDKGVEYIENRDAPTIRVHALHDLVVIGTDGLFTMVRFKKSRSGVLYKETELFIEMPIWAIPPGILLATKKIGDALVAPIASTVSRALRLQ